MFKRSTQVLQMIREGLIIDQNIIKKYDEEFPQVRSKNGVHSFLKGRRGVAKPKRHYQKLVMAVVGTKHCFVDIL